MFGDKIKYIPKRPGEAVDTLANIVFTKDILCWEPKESLEEYIEHFKGSL